VRRRANALNVRKLALVVGLVVIAGVVVWAVASRLGGDGGSPGAASGGGGGSEVVFSGTTLDGEPLDLETYRGKPVVVNFWASWCGYCEAEMPDLVKFAAAHPEVAVIGVDVNDDEGAALDSASKWGLTFPSVYDPDGQIFARFGTEGLPTTVFYDKDLKVVETLVGQQGLESFEDGLRKAQ
jgi:cytochrome c biogenesis protein CcmG/thiol:disulfide interchange protein DsbE